MTTPEPLGPSGLRRAAEALAQALPPLLAEARQLAATVQLGAHGRRRSGMGDEFWQYRPAHSGDEARAIDWRRSGRTDQHFVREKEWQAAQAVQFWVDDARSMEFSGDPRRRTKAERAQLLGLALAILLVRGGERVGSADGLLPPRPGELQVLRFAALLADREAPPDYGAPALGALQPWSRAVLLSDFLGDPLLVEKAVSDAADRGVSGVLFQILDPVEESFPFDGRTIFESMSGALAHETRKASDLRDRYLARLTERKARLAALCATTGWQFFCHHTDATAQSALLWLYAALGRSR